MKLTKLLLIGTCVLWSSSVSASSLSSFYAEIVESQDTFLDKLKDQVITKTKVTILEKGGAATFYDASVGKSDSLKVGAISHVISNRFLTGDIGFFGGTTGDTGGVLIGGVGLDATDAFSYYFPTASNIIKYSLPEKVRNFSLGAGGGWGTERGEFHWGGWLMYNF